MLACWLRYRVVWPFLSVLQTCQVQRFLLLAVVDTKGLLVEFSFEGAQLAHTFFVVVRFAFARVGL